MWRCGAKFSVQRLCFSRRAIKRRAYDYLKEDPEVILEALIQNSYSTKFVKVLGFYLTEAQQNKIKNAVVASNTDYSRRQEALEYSRKLNALKEELKQITEEKKRDIIEFQKWLRQAKNEQPTTVLSQPSDAIGLVVGNTKMQIG